LTPGDWHVATEKVLGTTAPEAKLATDDGVNALVFAAKAVAHAAIVSKRIEGTKAGDLQFRFMGQRSIPDSVVFSNLTNEARPWPSPLDIGAVMGSTRA